MNNKLDEKTIERIKYLLNQGLTQEVIGQRLGIAARTVRVYARSFRTGMKPYQKSAGSDTIADNAIQGPAET